jgi:signal transduction histidine kinase
LRRHTATVEMLATSRERNRLARDLHDTLAHSLSALTVQLEALRVLLSHDLVAAQGAVDGILELARRGLEDTRKAIGTLRADPVETIGLQAALRDALQGFQSRTGLQARFSAAGQARDLTTEEARTLFRIAEEALTDLEGRTSAPEGRASAQQVTVSLAFGSNCVELLVRDDGDRPSPDTAGEGRHELAAMHERAALIGATLQVESYRGGGTEVRCTLNR